MTAMIRRGFADAPTDFAAIRGKRITAGRFESKVSFGPGLRCEVWDNSANHDALNWELACRSGEHQVSVMELAGWLQGVVQPVIPTGWHFSRDDDSIGDYYLGWQRTYYYPTGVGAFVTENQRGSYYTLKVGHQTRQ